MINLDDKIIKQSVSSLTKTLENTFNDMEKNIIDKFIRKLQFNEEKNVFEIAYKELEEYKPTVTKTKDVDTYKVMIRGIIIGIIATLVIQLVLNVWNLRLFSGG